MGRLVGVAGVDELFPLIMPNNRKTFQKSWTNGLDFGDERPYFVFMSKNIRPGDAVRFIDSRNERAWIVMKLLKNGRARVHRCSGGQATLTWTVLLSELTPAN